MNENGRFTATHNREGRRPVSLAVRFWGVRGSIACPSPTHVRYGGNTSCLEVTAGEHTIILDAGTGIRSLGHSILDRGLTSAHLLLTHSHWDHINGFPFFGPGFKKGYEFKVMQASLTFEDFKAGESFKIGPDVTIVTAPLNHPNGATGYRVEFGGKSLCYVTDTEHVPGRPDQNVLGLIEGADLVIYDSTYTEDEFPAKVGWGHSTWQEAVALCTAAKVKQLSIFHHDPEHDDA